MIINRFTYLDVGFVVYDSTIILNMFLQLQVSKYVNISKNSTIQLVGIPQHSPIILQTKTGFSHSLPGQQFQNKNLKI